LGSGQQPPIVGPSGLSEAPVVRIRPCGRLTLAGAGPSLVGLRWLSGVQVRRVAPSLVQALPIYRAVGDRYSSPHREPQTVACDTPLVALRAPSGHTGGRHRSLGPVSPSWTSIPYSASGVADSVHAGLPHPPPSVLSVSHALDGLHPATPLRACFIPVTLLRFAFRALLLPGEPYLFRGRLLSCRSRHNPRR